MNRMTKSGIIDLFDGHFISDIIQHEKPSPHFFGHCLQNLKETSSAEILMVGDTPTSDIQGAVDAGLDSCYYQHNKDLSCAYAKYTIDTIPQLLDIV